MNKIYFSAIFALCSLVINCQPKLKLVKDLNPGVFGSLNSTYGFDSRLFALNGTLFMVADAGTNAKNYIIIIH